MECPKGFVGFKTKGIYSTPFSPTAFKLAEEKKRKKKMSMCIGLVCVVGLEGGNFGDQFPLSSL